jgi:hypothetical protein
MLMLLIKILLVGAAFLHLTNAPIKAQQFTFEDTEEGIEIREGNQKVLFYQKSPKSLEGQYERANYIHPLYGLNEEVLTEDFPEDHPHHRGVFWAWHQIMVNGNKIADGWTSENIGWDVENIQTDSNEDSATLKTTVLWKSILDGDSLKSIVLENTTINVLKSAPDFRIIDFEIILTPLIDNFQIGGSEDDKGYGGFSPRLKLPQDITFISQNKEVIPQTTAVKAGPWMDFYGSFSGVDASKSGVALYSHPENPGYPQPWILRAEKSMQNVVYPGENPIDIPKGKALVLKYRLVIHSDKVNQSRLEKLYKQYAKE